MVKFVVIENDAKMQAKIRDIILKTAFDIEDFKVEVYATLDKNLKETIKDISVPKIYILDIELDSDVSGIEIARKIRDNDWESHIIFLSNHNKMAEYAFRTVYEVFDFIEKFHKMEEKLTRDIKKILTKKFDNRFFKYATKNTELQIYLRDILYIYRDTTERNLCIKTTHNSFKLCLNLGQILERLDNRFKQVHRACIVNQERVQKYDWKNGEFTLDTGETVPLLSKKHKNEVVNVKC